MPSHSNKSEWISALIRFGEMSKEQAVSLAQKLSSLPAPSDDAKHYLTNEFLKKALNIESPADRSRIMLAVSRCPPPVDHGEDLHIDARAIPQISMTRAELRTALRENPSSVAPPQRKSNSSQEPDATPNFVTPAEASFVSNDSSVLVYRKMRDGEARFIDVCGGLNSFDMLAQPASVVEKSEYFKACCNVYDEITRRRYTAAEKKAMANGNPLVADASVAVSSSEDYIYGQAPRTVSEAATAALSPLVETEKVNAKSAMFAPLFANSVTKATTLFHQTRDQSPGTHLAQNEGLVNVHAGTLVAGQSTTSPTTRKWAQQIGTITLLVPSGCVLDLLEVKSSSLVNMFYGAPIIEGMEDPSVADEASPSCSSDTRFLTRWVFLVNKDSLSFALVHKDDTVGLAHFRNRWARANESKMNGEEPAEEEKKPNAEGVKTEEDEEEDQERIADAFADPMIDFYGTFLNEYDLALDDCDTVLDVIESHAIEKRGGKEMAAALYHLARRAASYQRSLELSSRTLAEAADFFDCTKDTSNAEARCARLVERSASIQDRSINLLNLVVSLSGFHTSDAFNVLTLISGSLTPVGFWATNYGQNWTLFPELPWKYSYFVLNLSMIIIIVGMLVFLKKKGL